MLFRSYLAIDIANCYGLNKLNFEDRIDWVKTNEKYLEDFGFIKNGGNWSIEYVEKPSQIQAPKNVEPKKENKGPISPAAKLFSYLNKKQLDKEQIKVFVNDVLGLTKEDTEGINEVLADLASLDIMVDEFLSNFNVPMEKEGLETGSLF